MSKNIQRVAKLETGLTPKQAILLWFQEAHGFNTIFEYIHHLKSQPDSAAPIPRLTDQVAEAVKQTLKGHPREEIDKAVRQAYKDVLFLFFLHQQVNRKLISEERYFWTQGRFLIAELKSLLREQALGRRMRWNQIRVGIETPYPLDSETAAAVEAAKQHYVMTWELLEEGDDLGQWLLESFLAKGNTALPDGAYGMMSGAKHLAGNRREGTPLIPERKVAGQRLQGAVQNPKVSGRLDSAGHLQLPVSSGSDRHAGGALSGGATGGQLSLGTGAEGHSRGRDGRRSQR